MTRKERFKDTSTFTYYNANPKNRITGDCVFRAFSLALNIDYNTAVMEMAQLMCETGYCLNDKKGEERYLTRKKWIRFPQPKKHDNTKFTLKEFCEKIASKDKRYIVSVGSHHIVAVVNGKAHDIWDCTNERVGVYYSNC